MDKCNNSDDFIMGIGEDKGLDNTIARRLKFLLSACPKITRFGLKILLKLKVCKCRQDKGNNMSYPPNSRK